MSFLAWIAWMFLVIFCWRISRRVSRLDGKTSRLKVAVKALQETFRREKMIFIHLTNCLEVTGIIEKIAAFTSNAETSPYRAKISITKFSETSRSIFCGLCEIIRELSGQLQKHEKSPHPKKKVTKKVPGKGKE